MYRLRLAEEADAVDTDNAEGVLDFFLDKSNGKLSALSAATGAAAAILGSLGSIFGVVCLGFILRSNGWLEEAAVDVITAGAAEGEGEW